MIGLACTYVALLGYGLMTLSPTENAHLSVASLRGFVVSEREVLVGGILTGPLFGWFGQQWRTRRALLGALATSAALCFEPLARRDSLNPIRFREVWMAEVAAGLVLAAYATLSRSRREPSPRKALDSRQQQSRRRTS